jgi:hypothetical protein
MAALDPQTKRPVVNKAGISVLSVVLLTAVALLLGAVLKSTVENTGKAIQRKDGVSAVIPTGWLVQDVAGDISFTAWEPMSPDNRFTVLLIPTDANSTLAGKVAVQNKLLEQSLTAFRILDQSAIERNGKQGVKVHLAYVEAPAEGLPVVMEGVDYYYLVGSKVQVVSWRTDSTKFAERLPEFERFLDSVSYQAGGQP